MYNIYNVYVKNDVSSIHIHVPGVKKTIYTLNERRKCKNDQICKASVCDTVSQTSVCIYYGDKRGKSKGLYTITEEKFHILRASICEADSFCSLCSFAVRLFNIYAP